MCARFMLRAQLYDLAALSYISQTIAIEGAYGRTVTVTHEIVRMIDLARAIW